MASEEPSVVEQTAPEKPKRVAPFHFIVREPFGDYRKGYYLTSAEVIDAVHDAGHAHKLIRVQVDQDFVEA